MQAHPDIALVTLLAAAPAQQALFTNFGPAPHSQAGERVAAGGDLDGDGKPDCLIQCPGAGAGQLLVVSGANGTVRTLTNPGAGSFANYCVGVPDLNLDGRGDLVVSVGSLLRVYSGASLTMLWQTPTAYLAAAPVGDRDGDGRGDLAAISTANELRVLRGSDGGILAQLPLTGSVGQPAIATNLGAGGCDAWFDLGSGSLLQTTTTTNWQFAFPVPAAPPLAGVRVALQAFYVPTLAPLGFDITNGVWATLGY